MRSRKAIVPLIITILIFLPLRIAAALEPDDIYPPPREIFEKNCGGSKEETAKSVFGALNDMDLFRVLDYISFGKGWFEIFHDKSREEAKKILKELIRIDDARFPQGSDMVGRMFEIVDMREESDGILVVTVRGILDRADPKTLETIVTATFERKARIKFDERNCLLRVWVDPRWQEVK